MRTSPAAAPSSRPVITHGRRCQQPRHLKRFCKRISKPGWHQIQALRADHCARCSPFGLARRLHCNGLLRMRCRYLQLSSSSSSRTLRPHSTSRYPRSRMAPASAHLSLQTTTRRNSTQRARPRSASHRCQTQACARLSYAPSGARCLGSSCKPAPFIVAVVATRPSRTLSFWSAGARAPVRGWQRAGPSSGPLRRATRSGSFKIMRNAQRLCATRCPTAIQMICHHGVSSLQVGRLRGRALCRRRCGSCCGVWASACWKPLQLTTAMAPPWISLMAVAATSQRRSG